MGEIKNQGTQMVDVAVVNTSEEIAEALEYILQEADWTTVRSYSVDFKRQREDLTAFLERHNPRVIVWDIAILYRENWEYFQTVRQLPAAKDRRFVLTTTNIDALESIVGHTEAIELVGKPYDLDTIVEAVRRAMESCPGR